MNHTIHDIPEDLARTLRRRAEETRRSLDAVILDAIRRGISVGTKRRDLSDIAGAWEEDPEFDRIMEEQRPIDPELWR